MDSDEDISRVSFISSNGNTTNGDATNDSLQNSPQNSSNHSRKSLNETKDESMIGFAKRPNKKRLYFSDSDSDTEANSNSNSNSKPNDASTDELDKDQDQNVDSSDDDDASRVVEKAHIQNESSEDESHSDKKDRSKLSGQSDGQSKSDASNRFDATAYRSARDTSLDLDNSDAESVPAQNSSKSVVEESTIPETDDEDDDDDDDGDYENEKSQLHCYSPRTRRSITGRRSIKLPVADSDEDDLFADEDETDDQKSTGASKQFEYEVESSDGEDEDEDKDEDDDDDDDDDDDEDEDGAGAKKQQKKSKRNRSIAQNVSAVSKTPNAKRFSINDSKRSISFKHSTPSQSPDIEFSDKSDDNKSMSIQSSSSESEMKPIVADDDSVVLLNTSDEENTKPNFKGVGTSTPGTKLIQPKLKFKAETTTKKPVSRAFYNEKTEKLANLRSELKENETLYERLGAALPDKGFGLQKRVRELQSSVLKMENELKTFFIEEDHLDEVQIVEATNNNKPIKKGQDWRDDLETIQPRWTGQQGMSTFNTQKTLTLNRIERIHKAIEKRPAETEFARQPDYLNVQLMPHQLYAIRWMQWRETQKPKGGLLADDMGLGKTLTVIGLVLTAKYDKNNSLAEKNSEGEKSETEDESDDEVERGHKKTYANQGGTLIVCPASLINQWEGEIENRVRRRKLTVLMHHGSKREERVHSICKYDVVITTYGVISSDHKNNSALFRIRWNRIVLDEAHQIRNHTTGVSKGCCDLRANMRWGLTGTPIQNKHMDVYSMLKYLRVTPFDDLPTFKKWINPNSEAGINRLHNIIRSMLLRRTKAELQIKGELQALPQKRMNVEVIQLTPDEANIYTKILAYSQTLFAQYMEQHQQRNTGGGGGGRLQLDPDVRRRLEQVQRFGQGTADVKTSQILVLLLRIRQICDHPGLIQQMLQDECDLGDDEEEYDSMDMNVVKQLIGLKINDGNDDSDGSSASEQETKPSNILSSSNKIYDFSHPSSKCTRAIEIVKRILRETNDKIVIVSQWVSFLNIISQFLHRQKVHYVSLTGQTPIKDRNNLVVSFNNPNSPERVMMLSLVAGGVGLNLTGANHLILLDPHWNPQLEAQAFDRVYRVGQTKDVEIYKLLCDKTVEKHIESIQETKLALSENVLTGKNQGGSKLTIQDMRKLFEM